MQTPSRSEQRAASAAAAARPTMIPPGFTFQPTDQELIVYYFQPWVYRQPLCCDIIRQADVYSSKPEELLLDRQQAYFFTTLRPSKCNRVPRRAGSGSGTWMLNTRKEGDPIKVPGSDGGEVIVGYKRNLSFHLGNVKKSTGFVMDEYALSPPSKDNDEGQQVVCVIRRTQKAINDAAKSKADQQLQASSSTPASPGVPEQEQEVSSVHYQKFDLVLIYQELQQWGAITPEEERQYSEVMDDRQITADHPRFLNVLAMLQLRMEQVRRSLS